MIWVEKEFISGCKLILNFFGTVLERNFLEKKIIKHIKIDSTAVSYIFSIFIHTSLFIEK